MFLLSHCLEPRGNGEPIIGKNLLGFDLVTLLTLFLSMLTAIYYLMQCWVDYQHFKSVYEREIHFNSIEELIYSKCGIDDGLKYNRFK